MPQFKIGDRVRIRSSHPSDSGRVGTVVGMREQEAGALRLQQCTVDMGTHTQDVLSIHLQSVKDAARLLRGEILVHWKLLDSSELADAGDDSHKISTLIQQRYGFSADRAAREVDLMMLEFEDKLRRAA